MGEFTRDGDSGELRMLTLLGMVGDFTQGGFKPSLWIDETQIPRFCLYAIG